MQKGDNKFVKTVTFAKTFPVSIERSWKLLCDVKQYPQFVPFITDITLDGPFKKGTVWYDSTTLLWIHQRVPHRIDLIDDKNHRLVFIVPVQGGEVVENFHLEKVGTQTKIVLSVSISLRPWIVEETVGRVLAARFGLMLSKALENLESYVKKEVRV